MIVRIITSNPGKAKEFRAAFEGLGIETEHVTVPYDEIQTSELEDVVAKGMEELRRKGMRDFLIDDSGLFIDGLGGFPGVYSSYVQKTIGNAGILDLMRGRNDRGAEFRCCIGCDLEGETVVVTGVCRGTVLKEGSGKDGFGFDPIFSVDGERSFAEVPLNEKNGVSHRGIATKLLIEELRRRGTVR